MRSDQGWFLWYWKVGPFHFGMDLTTWGGGFLFNLRYPRGLAVHLGPFYLTVEGSDLFDSVGRCFERLDDFIWRQFDRTTDWVEKRRRGRSGE